MLYVGIAFDPDARAEQHARNAYDTWWKLAAKRTDEWLDSRLEAELAEIDAIATERPRFNVRDNPHASEAIQRIERVRSAKTALLPSEESNKHYMRVAKLLRSRITSGELPPGAKISHTGYAAEFGVGVDTVKRACGLLADEGLLQSGHGYRVAPESTADKKWLLLSIDRPVEAAKALRNVMDDDQVRALMAAFVAASWRENPVVA